MSLILEALRRSEAERRRTSLPSLLGESAPPRTTRRSPWPIALAGLLIGALVAGALAWWLVRTREPVGGVGTPVAVAAAPESAAPKAATPGRERVPAAAYATLPPAATAPMSSAPSTPPAPSPALPTPAPPPALPTPAPPPAPMASDGVPDPLHADDPSRGPRPGDLPLDALLGTQREALPPLRLSMHVYADDPTRRFAIVDGQRLREGDALAEGLQVLAIQRDGLRLAWNDRVLWVPR